MLRDDCLNCARKHLAQALIIMIEIRVTALSVDYKWLAIAHIAEAESELCVKWLDVALELREHRKAYEEDGDYIIPIMEYIERLSENAKAEEEKVSSE